MGGCTVTPNAALCLLQVSIFTPHAADVGGPVSRVVVEAGATVRLAGLRRVALR